jgi:hypothetical protein
VPFSASPWLHANLKKSEMVKIDILSIAGQLFHSFILNMNGSSTIKLNSFNTLPSGLYFVRITSGSGQQMLRALKL